MGAHLRLSDGDGALGAAPGYADGTGDLRLWPGRGREPTLAPVTVYSELLKRRLGGRVDAERPVGALVAELLIRRPAARAAAEDPRALCDLLAYDEALVRLCDCLGVDQHLLEPFSPPTAREHAERALARRLPLLAILEEAPSD